MEKSRRSALKIMKELIKLLDPLKGAMAIAISTGVIGFVLAFGLGIIGGYALLSVMPGVEEAFSMIPFGGLKTSTYLISLIVCALLRGVLHYAEQHTNHYIAFKILARIREKVFNAMRRLAPAKLEGENQGNLITLIMGDIELLEVFYAHTISPIGIAMVVTVILFVYFMQFHPLVALLALLAQFTIGIIIPIIATKTGNKVAMSIRGQIGNLNGQFLDKLRGLREVIQYDQGDEALKNIDIVTGNILIKQKELRRQLSSVQAWIDTGIMTFGVLQILLVSYLISNNQMTVVSGFIVVLTQLSTFAPYINLASLGNTLTQTFACGERVLSLLEEEPLVADKLDGVDVVFDGIEGKGISFSYADGQKVLEDISFEVEKGEILGIMGKSGCGKSTLLKLIMRFWDTKNGTINMSGQNIKEINTKSLKDNINYMTQTTVLFAGSLRDNLLIAKADATDDEIYTALKKASLYEYVMGLPKKLDSAVADLGDNFSGGERQRIGLARCFLSDRDLMLLDEPTSNLDSQNEAIILKAIATERENKTVILVSHRLSTLGVCDRIIKMKDGRFID